MNNRCAKSTPTSTMSPRKTIQSDSDGESSADTIPKKTIKIRVGDLPPIRDITIVNSNNFSEKKVKLGEEVESGEISRVAIEYKYDEGERNLCLTCPKDSAAYFRCSGVEEETYAKKGGKRVGTGKNVLKLYFDVNNAEHEKFHEVLLGICAVVKKKIERATGEKGADVKIRGLYDVIDDKKNVTGHALAARLIESGAGVVYTAAYNDEGQVHVKDIGLCDVRPGIIFSYAVPAKAKDGYRINVSVNQLYFKPRSIFPLRDLE